jgi:hypothetical protein
MPNPIESVVAKVTGKAAAVEARMKGLKGVFNKLAEQHHEVGSLLSRAAKADDFTSRAGLWHQIRRELVSHEQAELLEVYPVLEANGQTQDLARAHANDAGGLEELIRELDSIGVQAAAWESTLARLIEKVNAHVELEENQLFPTAQAVIGEEAAKLLEEPFLKAKEMAMGRLA